MFSLLRYTLLIVFCLNLLPLSKAQSNILTNIVDNHPRLIWNKQRIDEIKIILKTDQALQGLLEDVKVLGNYICQQPPASYHITGTNVFRLLRMSRQTLGRVLTLGTLHFLDPDPKWKTRMLVELEAVCSFKDWNPDHFLDTAEMSAAVGIAYDWLYNDLSVEDRTWIREALIEKALKDPRSIKGAWVKVRHNWNQVCHAGLVAAALALGNEAPEYAERILKSAKVNHLHGLKPYFPDGVYPEGPAYWHYGTSYSILMASMLSTAIGNDWGLLNRVGFKESFDYRIYAESPSGRLVNYSDSRDRSSSLPVYWFMSHQLNKPEYASFALRSMIGNRQDVYRSKEDLQKRFPTSVDDLMGKDFYISRFFALALPWYNPKRGVIDLPLDFFITGRSQVHLALMRSKWNDQNALFASLKAGKHTVGHGHLDAGSFIIDWGGIRWASEFPPERRMYDTKGTGNKKQESIRWDFFRTNNFGHNTLTINEKLQRVVGKSPITKTGSGESPFAITDLSLAYATESSGVKRGIKLINREKVLIQDEISGVKKGKLIRWNMITEAQIRILKNRKIALLEKGGKTMVVSLLSPSSGQFSSRDATPPRKDENQNEGYQRLVVDCFEKGEKTVLSILFSPNKIFEETVSIIPLEDW